MKTDIKDEILIKKAEKSDIPAIVLIHKKCVSKNNAKLYSPRVIRAWLKQITEKNVSSQFKNSSWTIAKINHDIVGFSQYSTKDKTIYQINIDPEFQRKGVGNLLYKYIEDAFLKRGIESIHLYSTLNAVGFYQRMGFRKIKNVKFKIGKGSLTELEMTKNLCGSLYDQQFKRCRCSQLG